MVIETKDPRKGVRRHPHKKDGMNVEESASPEKVFSGDASRELWAEIDALDALSTGDDIRDVLYSFGCALQRLEAKMACMVDFVMDQREDI